MSSHQPEKTIIRRSVEVSCPGADIPADLAPDSLDVPFLSKVALHHRIVGHVVRFLSLDGSGERSSLRPLLELNNLLRLAAQGRISELSTLRRLFDEAGIPVMTFKGPSLSHEIFDDAQFRHPGDLDLLVRKEHFVKASELLRGRGYTPTIVVPVGVRTEIAFDSIERCIVDRNSIAFRHSRCNVDLHWTLDDPPYKTGIDPGRVWETSRTVVLSGTPHRILGLEELFQFLCFHGSKHIWQRLCWVADVAAIASKQSLDWDEVSRRAVETQKTRMLNLAVLLAHNVSSAQLPNNVVLRARRDPIARYLAQRVSGSIFSDYRSWRTHEFRILHYQTMAEKFEYIIGRLKYLSGGG